MAEALSVDQAWNRIKAGASALFRAGMAPDAIARHLEKLAESRPKDEARQALAVWTEVQDQLAAGRHAPSVILSHLRALREAAEPSSVRALAPEIREELDRLVREGATIDAITAHLRSMGAPVSRSAVGRYRQKAEAQLRRYREAQEIAGVWVAKLGENPQGDVGRLLQEMLKTAAFQTMATMAMGDEEGGDGATPKDLALLARMIKDLAGAEQTSTATQLKIRQELAERVAGRLADAEEDVAAADTPEARAAVLRRIREEVYGIVEG